MAFTPLVMIMSEMSLSNDSLHEKLIKPLVPKQYETAFQWGARLVKN